MRFYRIFFLLPALFFAGCMVVEDFGSYWDKGTLDPFVEGRWISNDKKACGSYILEGDHYISSDNSFEQMKTLEVNGSKFLMSWNKQPEDVKYGSSKNMIKYTADENKLVFFNPKREKQEEFETTYDTTNFEIGKHSVRIKVLDEKTIEILGSVGANPDYWEEGGVMLKRDEPCPPEEE